MAKNDEQLVSGERFNAQLIEKEVLNFWMENGVFQKSISQRPQERKFVFYDGPPFANGLPHYGHLLTGFIKDTIARYQTMCGFRVERRFGWDCHGLPAEMAAEKELGISGRLAIEQYGIDKFNSHCRASVMKFAQSWRDYVTRQARWVDFDNSYKTMDLSFMQSVMSAFKRLYESGLIYQSIRIVPYSWACETPLSNFETKLDNSYRQKASKTVTVAFELLTKPALIPANIKKCKLLVWTTTPWTLPSNLALAIGPDIDYVGALIKDELYIFSRGYLPNFQELCKKNNLEYVEYKQKFSAQEFSGLRYKPLFSYFSDKENAFRVLLADFVVDGEGTGIVHIAPGFGEDDFELCQQHNIAVVCPIDSAGCFTIEITDLVGMQVFEANDLIIKKLKESGAWLKTEQYLHNYPHCWRTDTPLIYRAMPSWYLKVTELKDIMIKLNTEVNWIPAHIRDGQFGKWLANARDWSISRNRFWGTPIPVWQSDDPRYPCTEVYGSLAELKTAFAVTDLQDLHRPYIDELTKPNPNDPTGKSMLRRVPEVFDCWFESGAMPFSQKGDVFDNFNSYNDDISYRQKNFNHHRNEYYGADFITEYVAQTRGWFYTLFVLHTALFNVIPEYKFGKVVSLNRSAAENAITRDCTEPGGPPFKNVICHGVVLDTAGRKLSKRLNNYPDPMEIFDQYGADALRFLMLSSSVASGGDLLLDSRGEMVRDVVRTVILPIWHSYRFFNIYMNIDNIKPEILKIESEEYVKDSQGNSIEEHTLDDYIINFCKLCIAEINYSLQKYLLKDACNRVVVFFDHLNNWYIRRSRFRFWASDLTQDKKNAYNTLYTILHYMCRATAPLLPLTMEALWIGLKFPDAPISVHLTDFPIFNKSHNESYKNWCKRSEIMNLIKDICSKAHEIRVAKALNVRQPLSKIKLYGPLDFLSSTYQEIIKDELNVKELELVDDFTAVASEEIKLDFPKLGKRIPDKIKVAMQHIKSGNWQQVADNQLILGDNILIAEDEYTVKLNLKVDSAAIVNKQCAIVLDTNLTPDLQKEGIARNLVRLIQRTRKEMNLQITSKIVLSVYSEHPDYIAAVKQWHEYISAQTLASSLQLEECSAPNNAIFLEEGYAAIVIEFCRS